AYSRFVVRNDSTSSTMKKKRAGRSGFLQIRTLIAVVFCWGSVVLAMLSFAPPVANRDSRHEPLGRLQRYMPVPGGDPDDMNRMEEEWNNRLTYPTGIFNPVWLRQAAAADSLISRAIPAGVPLKNLDRANGPLALNSSGF